MGHPDKAQEIDDNNKLNMCDNCEYNQLKQIEDDNKVECCLMLTIRQVANNN